MRARPVAAVVVAALAGALTSACSADVVPDGDVGGCASFEAVESKVAAPVLDIEPNQVEPGGHVVVARVDGEPMNFSTAFLFSDARAGCRTFVLTLDDDEGAWRDVTGEKDLAVGGLVSPATRERYPVPSAARAGSHVLCVLVDVEIGSDGLGACGRFEI